jgi:hypothetical protein
MHRSTRSWMPAWRCGAIGLLVLACLSATPSRTTAAVPHRAKVTFSFAKGVGQGDQQLVREGIRLAQDYFIAAFGVDVREPVVVDVVLDPNSSLEAMAQGHRINVNAANAYWVQRAAHQNLKTVVHEYFHVLQLDLTGAPPESRLAAPPQWLLEGSAEYVAYQALAWKGILGLDDVRAFNVRNVIVGQPSPPSLQDLETAEQFQSAPGAVYGIGALAVELLTMEPGLGSLRDYYEAVAGLKESAWWAAFKEAFGQDPDTFYEAFAAYRAALVPSDVPLTMFDPVTASDAPAAVSIISVTSPLARGAQARLTAATVPGSRCTLVFSAADGKQLPTRPAIADATGAVFWLWTLHEKQPIGVAGAQVDCGDAPATVAVEVT